MKIKIKHTIFTLLAIFMLGLSSIVIVQAKDLTLLDTNNNQDNYTAIKNYAENFMKAYKSQIDLDKLLLLPHNVQQ